jgi:crotonobetainyl-CoA:carnitine CoA-transferase CaiB-like acyl-CoA transferase
MGILSGYRVIDLTIAMAGPLAAMRLGDLGADVIKVEPVSGEWQRHTPAGGAAGHQINASFLSLNRNKRSLAVNLKSAEGREIVLELARGSEVFLQNYRPGVAERLGMDYESIRAVRPDIVYVSISGYGESGPYVNRPGQDMLLQAMSGAMLNVGRASDPPAPAGTYAVDAITGYGAFEGALAGLLHRERTGEGQLVTVNMLDSAIAVQAQELSIYTVGGIPQHRGEEVHGHTYIRAPYGTFATADGYLALAFPPLAQLGEALGVSGFAGMDDDADGHTRRDEITALVRARLPERSTAAWLAEFDARGIWAGPVYDYADVVTDPQVRHNGSLVSYDHPTEGRVTTPGFPYRFSATPPEVYRGAPLAGEQTREILGELGYDGESVDRLAAGGVVAAPEAAGQASPASELPVDSAPAGVSEPGAARAPHRVARPGDVS